jgi:hypothetical protein
MALMLSFVPEKSLFMKDPTKCSKKGGILENNAAILHRYMVNSAPESDLLTFYIAGGNRSTNFNIL